jgi:hypothetical protein
MNNRGCKSWLCFSYHRDLKVQLCFQLCDHWRWSFEQPNNSLLFISWLFRRSLQLKSFQSETLSIGYLSRWKEDKSSLLYGMNQICYPTFSFTLGVRKCRVTPKEWGVLEISSQPRWSLRSTYLRNSFRWRHYQSRAKINLNFEFSPWYLMSTCWVSQKKWHKAFWKMRWSHLLELRFPKCSMRIYALKMHL